MKIFIEGMDCDVWDAVVSFHLVNDVVENKPRTLWICKNDLSIL
jgi:hypothetical protein